MARAAAPRPLPVARDGHNVDVDVDGAPVL